MAVSITKLNFIGCYVLLHLEQYYSIFSLNKIKYSNISILFLIVLCRQHWKLDYLELILHTRIALLQYGKMSMNKLSYQKSFIQSAMICYISNVFINITLLIYCIFII